MLVCPFGLMLRWCGDIVAAMIHGWYFHYGSINQIFVQVSLGLTWQGHFFTVCHLAVIVSQPSVLWSVYFEGWIFLYWLSMIDRGSVLLGLEPILICQNKSDYWENQLMQAMIKVLKWWWLAGAAYISLLEIYKNSSILKLFMKF